MSDQQMHQIGSVSESVGLSLRTIRHYEEVGLVVPSGRSPGGFRLYTDHDVERLRLVKKMKPLKFSLEEIRDVLTLLDTPADHPDHADDAERPEGRARADRLEMHATLASERCERLREQLAAAAEFTDTLTRTGRTARAAASGSQARPR